MVHLHCESFGSDRRRSLAPYLISGLLCTTMIVACNSAPIAAAEPDAPSHAQQHLHIGGGDVAVSISPEKAGISDDAIIKWVRTAAQAATAYYGRFPVPHVEVHVVVDGSGKIHGGVTYGGRLIRIHLGLDTTQADLDDDWMMTHEMFHLAFPDMGDEHLWMNEGLSTYLEPIARAQIGNLSVDELWRQTVEGMPQGQPEPGDRGLDRTHTWGRTYWGGAMFWLLADVRIRQQTHNRDGLARALRAILDAGGDGSADWTVDRVVEVGDRTTHTNVLKDLYAEMATNPVKVDLDALWKHLGIQYSNGRVTLDDHAPLAAVRIAMTARVSE